MVRGESIQRKKILGIFHRTVFIFPARSAIKAFVTDHVEKWSDTQNGSHKVLALGHHCGHQQTCVRSTIKTCFARSSDSFSVEPFDSRDKVVERCLTLPSSSGSMPFFS